MMSQDKQSWVWALAALLYVMAVSLLAFGLLALGHWLDHRGLGTITQVEAWITAAPLGIPAAPLAVAWAERRRLRLAALRQPALAL
jgi:hypothetical protein